MKQFEDMLMASAQRFAHQENRNLHVPKNPMQQKRAYWGWVATPAAAVVGIVFGMSMHLFTADNSDATLVQSSDLPTRTRHALFDAGCGKGTGRKKVHPNASSQTGSYKGVRFSVGGMHLHPVRRY